MTRRRSFLALAGLLTLSPPAARAQGGFAGDWAGTYHCGQGLTGLHLRLRAQDDGQFSGLFHFHAVTANPDVPEGCFLVTARAAETRLTITAGRWLLRPDDYVTVDMVGELDADGTLYGQVEGPSCQLFALQRVPAGRSLPDGCGVLVSSR